MVGRGVGPGSGLAGFFTDAARSALFDFMKKSTSAIIICGGVWPRALRYLGYHIDITF
jgi:hypothetical protein